MDIEKIKARLAAASKGPWHAARAGSPVGKPYAMGTSGGRVRIGTAEDDCILGDGNEEILGCSEWLRAGWEDLEFMAHARQDIEDLISATEAMQAKLDEKDKELEALREYVNDMGGDKDFLKRLDEYDPGHRLDRHRREELSEFFGFGVAYMRAKLDAKDKELAALHWQREEWVDWILGLAANGRQNGKDTDNI